MSPPVVRAAVDPVGRNVCYAGPMTREQVKEIVDRVLSWPEEDQEEFAQVAREIEARRTGVYRLTDDEREAIERGLADMRQREFASDDDIAAIFRKARSPRA
jgi:hypothetical protein